MKAQHWESKSPTIFQQVELQTYFSFGCFYSSTRAQNPLWFHNYQRDRDPLFLWVASFFTYLTFSSLYPSIRRQSSLEMESWKLWIMRRRRRRRWWFFVFHHPPSSLMRYQVSNYSKPWLVCWWDSIPFNFVLISNCQQARLHIVVGDGSGAPFFTRRHHGKIFPSARHAP